MHNSRFTVKFAHLHYNKICHVHLREAILGYFVILVQIGPASTLDYTVMQTRKVNREKGYWRNYISSVYCSQSSILYYIITQDILAIWLVLAYDLLEDGRTIDAIITEFLPLPF